jgi:hypothetical protein
MSEEQVEKKEDPKEILARDLNILAGELMDKYNDLEELLGDLVDNISELSNYEREVEKFLFANENKECLRVAKHLLWKVQLELPIYMRYIFVAKEEIERVARIVKF